MLRIRNVRPTLAATSLWLALGACQGTPLPGACDDELAAPLAACFGGASLPWEGFGTVAGTVEGTLRTVTDAPFPSACTATLGGEPAARRTVLEVEDDAGVVTTVGLSLGDVSIPLAVDQAVTLDLSFTPGDFGPDVGWVRVRDAGGTEQVVYTIGGTVADLTAPAGVALAEGDRVCTEAESCGDWAAYALQVTTDGVETAVGYGSLADAGPWRVLHGGLERQLEPNGGCPDYYVAHVEAAFLRR